MLDSLIDEPEGYPPTAEPMYCDGCGEPFDFFLDVNDDGHEVEVADIALETANGVFCAACAAAGEEEE